MDCLVAFSKKCLFSYFSIVAFLSIVGFGFLIGCKEPVYVPVRPANAKEDSLNQTYRANLLQKDWHLSAIKVSPPLNGSSSLKLDSCDAGTLLNFQNDTYGSTGGGVQATGDLLLKYLTGSCNSSLPAGSSVKTYYTIFVDSNKVYYWDNNASVRRSYSISKLKSDTLTLSYQLGSYVYNKIYVIK